MLLWRKSERETGGKGDVETMHERKVENETWKGVI
jgi:hypothetical protein